MAGLFGTRRPIRIAGHLALALGSLAACLWLEAASRLPAAGRLAVALAGIGGYIVFARLAVLAWEPDIERLWRSHRPEGPAHDASEPPLVVQLDQAWRGRRTHDSKPERTS